MKMYLCLAGENNIAIFSSKEKAEDYKNSFPKELWDDTEVFEVDDPKVKNIPGYYCFELIIDKDENIIECNKIVNDIYNVENCKNLNTMIVPSIIINEDPECKFEDKKEVFSDTGFLSLYTYAKSEENAKLMANTCFKKLSSLNLWPIKLETAFYLIDEKPEWYICKKEELIPLMMNLK